VEIEHGIKLDSIVISNHLQSLGDEFTRALKKTVQIDDYARKLSQLSNMNGMYIDQDLVGLVAYYQNIEIKELFISHVGVVPNWQKNGFAVELVNSVISESSGFRIRLEVAQENFAARRLYESLNFKVSGIFETTLTMERIS
jgi:ribosomal protein S18 acetylase RimI-like enzyme